MPVSDIIYLRELTIEMFIGIYAWEQQIKQRVVLDIELACDIKPAVRSASVKDTIDYADIAKQINQLIADKKFTLLEIFIESVADLLLTTYKTPWVRIKANKVAAVPNVKAVGIIIERTA